MMPYAEVIGDPIAHSKSPSIHAFWLEKLGIAAEYRATQVAPADLAGYFTARGGDPAWRGCNITIPHKVAALDLVEDRGGLRDGVGAINCVIREGDAVIGTNTDIAGFYAPIADLDLTGATVAVVGAGGAARAVLFALARMGAGDVHVFNRDVDRAAALLERFGLAGEAHPLDHMLPPARLLVNASSLGMIGQPALILDLAPLPDDATVYDLVYAPLMTPLLFAADDRNLMTIDGLDMLVGQAAVAFELFFDAEAPRRHDAELRALLTA